MAVASRKQFSHRQKPQKRLRRFCGVKSQVLFELFIVTAEYALPYLGARARICLVVAPRGHAPSTVSCLPHCLGDSNVGICHEVVRVVGGAENTSARNDNDDWIDTCRPQALGLVNKYRIVLSKWHELHSPGSASQISAVVLSYIAGISLAGRAKWRFGIGVTILGAVLHFGKARIKARNYECLKVSRRVCLPKHKKWNLQKTTASTCRRRTV